VKGIQIAQHNFLDLAGNGGIAYCWKNQEALCTMSPDPATGAEEVPMTAAVGPRILHPSAPTPQRASGHGPVVISGVRWQTYQALLEDLGDRHIRLTYDRGNLEITAPQFRHERYSGVLGQLVKALASAAKVRVKSAGSTTFSREDLGRGLEPDRCFYIRNVDAVLGKLDIDLSTDPPPDLAIEIDITSSCLDRLGIYAALGVPEVWRFDGEQFEVLLRRDETGYNTAAASPTFPTLPIAEVAELLHDVVALDDETQERRVRAWVRKHAPARRKGGPRRKGK
jgi:Uma2 family endonuclease